MPIIIDYAQEITPISADVIMQRCGTLLLDEDHTRWTMAELIDWINEGIGEIINMRPAAGATLSVMPLAAGSKQRLPADGVQLLDVVRNMASDGITAGKSITRADRGELDRADPGWHAATASDRIRHYCYDDRSPRVFLVYPPAIANTQVELSYAALPARVEDKNNLLGIQAEYEPALVNYVMFRAKSKDSEFSNAAEAAAYYQAFMASVGNEATGAVQTSPNGARP